MSVYQVHAVPKEARRRYWIPRNWIYNKVLTAMWVLESKPRFSTRAAKCFLMPELSLQPERACSHHKKTKRKLVW